MMVAVSQMAGKVRTARHMPHSASELHAMIGSDDGRVMTVQRDGAKEVGCCVKQLKDESAAVWP